MEIEIHPPAMCTADSNSVMGHQEDDQNMWSELNSDVVELIFSRLPEESICRAASVCKRWHSVIEMPTFCEFYKKIRIANSCGTFLCRVNGVNYTFTERSEGQGRFSFQPVEKRYNVPTVFCSEDGHVPTIQAAGGLHLACTGVKQTILRYKLSLVENNWRTTPEMPYFVQNPVVGVVEGIRGGSGHKLVVAGGLPINSDEDDELTVSIYDDRTNSWEYCDPLPYEFRSCASSIFMAAVVHESRFYVYDMYSGLVSWLDLDSKRWSKVIVLRPSRKVSPMFLVSRSGALRLVGVEGASERDVPFTVWKIEDEFGEIMRVGEILYSSVLRDACSPRSTAIQRWKSWSIEFSSSIIGVLLLLFVQFLIQCYKASKRVYCFLQGILNSTAIAARSQKPMIRSRPDRVAGA